jgi:hypothetical protein
LPIRKPWCGPCSGPRRPRCAGARTFESRFRHASLATSDLTVRPSVSACSRGQHPGLVLATGGLPSKPQGTTGLGRKADLIPPRSVASPSKTAVPSGADQGRAGQFGPGLTRNRLSHATGITWRRLCRLNRNAWPRTTLWLPATGDMIWSSEGASGRKRSTGSPPGVSDLGRRPRRQSPASKRTFSE